MLYDQVDYAGLAGSLGFDAKGVYREVENLMLFVHNYTKTGETVAFGFAFCGDIFFVGCQRVIISS